MQSIFERVPSLEELSLNGGLWLVNIHSVPATVHKVELEDLKIEPLLNQEIFTRFHASLETLLGLDWGRRLPMESIIRMARGQDPDLAI